MPKCPLSLMEQSSRSKSGLVPKSNRMFLSEGLNSKKFHEHSSTTFWVETRRSSAVAEIPCEVLRHVLANRWRWLSGLIRIYLGFHLGFRLFSETSGFITETSVWHTVTSQLFNTPLLFNAPDEGIPKDICSVFGIRKLESTCYKPCWLMVSSLVLTQCTHVNDVKDGQTDGHTSHDSRGDRTASRCTAMYNVRCIWCICFAGKNWKLILYPGPDPDKSQI